jgi:phosphoribosylaminoimidazole-succinocarboxamide synthase
MVVIKTQPIDVECVVRGYIAGSAWTEYCDEGTVSGIKLPKGLQLGDRLPSPIFSPAIKNHAGHDTNINFEHLRELVGDLTANALKSASEALFQFGSDWVSTRGLILADTKFEFGWLNKTLLLIDEALTPDSSRYWDQATYQPGQSPPSFDKQLVRDYLTSVWKEPEPIQALPESLINRVSERYLNGFEMITGTNLLP